MRRIRNLNRSNKLGLVLLLVALLGVGGVVAFDGGPDQDRVAVLGAATKKPAVPTITSGPSGPTNSGSATFVFKATPTPKGYLCKLDTEPFLPCSSPKTYGELAAGPHSFQVASQDGGFPSDPAVRNWTVDLDPPLAPTITEAPENPSFDAKAHFAYYSEAGATFDCQLDNDAAQACGSSVDYKKLSFGDHTFTVTAIDAAENSSASASYNWTVLENKAFAVTGNAAGPLYPGVTQRLALRLSNPYNFPIQVFSVDVTATEASAGCDLEVASLEVVDLSAPVDVPANSSVTLGSSLQPTDSWPTGWPTIKMLNTDVNQDDCKNATFTLSYTGTASKS